MDILAHTLWANYGARYAKSVAQKRNKKLDINFGWTAFFGVAPDFFAFTIPFLLTLYKIIIGEQSTQSFGGHHMPIVGFDLAAYLYQYSHSLVVWLFVFCLVWIIYKRPRYELFGWALHILIDIPSHTIGFFPTPFLFPISEYRFPYGVSWGNAWYMIINYSLLLFFSVKIFLQKNRNFFLKK